MKVFLASSAGMFLCITAAEHASQNYQAQHNKDQRWLMAREQSMRSTELAQQSTRDRIIGRARQEKYKLIGAAWIVSMIGSFVLVGRNPYLTGQQKIVQARVYAQGLTVAILCASAGLEIAEQRRGRGILDAQKVGVVMSEVRQHDAAENSKHHGEADLWKDMVAAEELRLKRKHLPLYEHEHAHGLDDEASLESSASDETSADGTNQEAVQLEPLIMQAEIK